MGIETKLEFFSETRHSYGRTALLLSGGATFGKFHFGLLSALYEHDLFPRIICGSSVGALVASAFCCYSYSELPKLFDPKYVFGHPMLKTLAEGKLELIWKMLTGKTILCTETLKEYIRRHSGDITFKEIYDKHGWCLNVTVTDFSMNKQSRLLNYLTTPNVVVWSAVVASCSIPGFFAKVDLYQKLKDGTIIPYDPSSSRMMFVDGSVASDLPMQRLAELFNVNTFIVSQVNPHVCPFVSVDTGSVLDTKWKKLFVMKCKQLAGNSIKFLFKQLAILGLLPNYIASISSTIV